jgi:hypothetical protein
LNRRVGLLRPGKIARFESRRKRFEVLRQPYALEAGTRRAVGQSAKGLLGSDQVAGLESLRELLKLGPLLLIRVLQVVCLVQCAALGRIVDIYIYRSAPRTA